MFFWALAPHRPRCLPPTFAGFLLGLFIDAEDGGDMYLRTARHYKPEEGALHSYRRENLKSNLITWKITWA
jgi:hypothetical protein